MPSKYNGKGEGVQSDRPEQVMSAPPCSPAAAEEPPSPPTPVEDAFPAPTDEELVFERAMERHANETVWEDTCRDGRERHCSG